MQNKYDLCCVGHITLDKVVTPRNTVYMPGGTAYYFSHAIRHFHDINYSLVTALAESEMDVVEDLRAKGLPVTVMPSRHSVYFENIYGENQNNRTQRVLAKADPFTVAALEKVDAKVYLLGALLADDFSLDLVKYLSQKGLVVIDSQGYLREVRDSKVFATDWTNKQEMLKYVYALKANEEEMEMLTGHKDIQNAARTLHEWGVKEVLITLGSLGSVIYDGTTFYQIPAYEPTEVIDATGCGDTYMTGYLYQRSKGVSIPDSGKFAAAMATLKIQGTGPFNGSELDVEACMKSADVHIPELN